MGSLALLLLVVGGFLMYETFKAIKPSDAATTSTSSTEVPPSTAVTSPDMPSGNHFLGHQYQPSDLAAFAYNAGFRGQELVQIVAISLRESSGFDRAWNYNPPNPSASNPCLRSGSYDYGVLQINSCAHAGAISNGLDVYNPQQSFNYARQLVNEVGFSPWDSSAGITGTVGAAVQGVNQFLQSLVAPH